MNDFTLGMKTADQLYREEEQAKLDAVNASQTQPLVSNLVAYFNQRWNLAREAKRPIASRMRDNLRQRQGIYADDKLQAIRAQGGSDIYANITNVKCRAASAWLRDALLGDGKDKPWGLSPSPIPELPPDLEQEALYDAQKRLQQAVMMGLAVDPNEAPELARKALEKVRSEMRESARREAEMTEAAIEDTLDNGGFHDAFSDVIDDLVTYPAAILKGPVIRQRVDLAWGKDPETGATLAVPTEKIVTEYERVSPFDLFPAPWSMDIEDGYLIQRHRLSRSVIAGMIGLPGYNEDAVRAVLKDHDDGGASNWLGMGIRGEDTTVPVSTDPKTGLATTYKTEMIDALELWDNIPGRLLVEWGIPAEQIPDPDKEYSANVWKIKSWVIKATLNHDPVGKKPYSKTSYERVPGMFWGLGIPDLIKDPQDVANAALRAMVNNMGMCLTGDTVVYRHQRPGAAKQRKYDGALCEVTLNQLWEQKQQPNSGLRRNIIRSLDEETGELFGNRIVDIYDNGTQPVYRLTTARGYSVKATLTHRFMDETGEYRHLADLVEGDLIAVNGTQRKPRGVCQECSAPLVKKGALRCRKCASQFSVSAWNQSQAKTALSNRSALDTTARGRKLVRDQMGSACETCGGTTRLHIHHIDKDPLNCNPANLMTLCEPCHNAWHARYDHYGDPRRHTFVDYDVITAIEYAGEERVFDLHMTAPNHNFVANGFISHNCSGPQVIVNVERLPEGAKLTTLHPWKIWQMVSDPIGSTAPPVEFFNVPSNAAELMAIFESASNLADEYSGIPKYMTGEGKTGGAARTASGLSMLIGNASKLIKSVTANVDRLIESVIRKTHIHLITQMGQLHLAGDIGIVVRGSEAILQKDNIALRRTEFLQLTANPVDMQIVGIEGRANILKEQAKLLGLNPDEIVKDGDVLQAEQMMQQMFMAQQMAAVPNGENTTPGMAQGLAKTGGRPAASAFDQPSLG